MSIRAVKIAEKVVILISATILLYLFVYPDSPVYIVSFLPYVDIDLSFLLAPFTVLFVFLFASSISSLLVKRGHWKDVIRKVLYGLAIATFIFTFFSWAPIPTFATAILFSLELTTIVFTGSTIAMGLVKRRKRYEPLYMALCTGIVAYAIYNIARTLSQAYETIVYAFLPFTVGLLAVSVGALFGLFRDTDKFVISKISGWISKGPIRNFTLSFFFTIYVNFVRPSAEDFPPIVIGEWMTIALSVAVILNVAKGSSKELRSDFKFQDWKKHTIEAERQTGRAFQHLVSAQEKFVKKGIKEPLLIYLTLTLRDLGKTEQKILMALTSLVQYRDKQPSFWNLPWTKRKLEETNMMERRKLLDSLVREIERAG